MPAQPPSPAHFDLMKDAASRGALAFFYGAGINFPQFAGPNRQFDQDADFCPTGAELSLYLAERYDHPDLEPFQEVFQTHQQELNQAGSTHPTCPFAAGALPLLARARIPNLAEVSQYAQTTENRLGHNLQLDLHQLFDRQFPSTPMHDLLARIPSLSKLDRRPVFITTNYDTVLERALVKQKEPFDILFYRAPGPATPVWLYHWENAHLYYGQNIPAVEGWDKPVVELSKYDGLPVGDGLPLFNPDGSRVLGADGSPKQGKARTVIVKIHGTVAPSGHESSSFVISRSDYVTFLRQVSTKEPLPSSLVSLLQKSHFVFLGYGLSDWNIMALCQNLWGTRTLKAWKNWAVQFHPSEHDCEYWSAESAGRVTVFDQDITAYATALEAALF